MVLQGVRRSGAARPARLAAIAALAVCGLRALLGAQEASTFAAEPAARFGGAGRRQQLLSTAVATAGAVVAGVPEPAAAIQTDERKDEIIRVPSNQRTGTSGYLFEKPKGFKRFASPVDPSGFVFRALDDPYYTFVLRSEKRDAGDAPFTPQAFIADYQNKFVNATGSSFELLSKNDKPDREDKELGVEYWTVEYVVRTQLGFAFDSLKSLHFLTTFAASKDNIVILNAQALDDKWDTAEGTLRKISNSFSLTGQDEPGAGGFFGLR